MRDRVSAWLTAKFRRKDFKIKFIGTLERTAAYGIIDLPLTDRLYRYKKEEQHGSGSSANKKGYYYMVLNLKSEDGNRKSKWISTGIPATGKKSAKLAEEMLAETRCTYKDAASPCAVSPVISREDISFSDYMIKWLGIIKNSVEVDTYAGYVNNVEKRIVPYFRGQRILLRELTALDVENFYSYCFNELHLKGTTVQRFHANIHTEMRLPLISE